MTQLEREIRLHDVLRAMPAVDEVDVQLATMLIRRAGDPHERGGVIAMAAALLSRALRNGHSGITTTQLARQSAEFMATLAPERRDMLCADSAPVHESAWWDDVLYSSPLVGHGQSVTPLVLRDGLLQFHRYFAAEQRIARRLKSMLRLSPLGGVPAFALVTGGPGTGKTTFVATVLATIAGSSPAARVALVAPTGKAAARLSESIIRNMPPAEAERAALLAALGPLKARTLHRLLGYRGDTQTFRHNAGNSLPHDVVIVDEASMVDVLMLDALLQALKPDARLILVGDHHQLSSVEAGDVMGVLCRAASQPSGEVQLPGVVTRLTRSWRFSAEEGIGALAAAILSGDADLAWRLGTDTGGGSAQILVPASTGESFLTAVLPYLGRCLAAESVVELLDALAAFRLLSPEREGRSGVRGLNATVERWLARNGRPVNDPWYHGRPVLVTANDYATGVFNGDIGVVWRSEGHVAVHFRNVDGSVRAIAPGRLPAVETAWAMTVHKSQGSEFDAVVVVLPPDDSRVMSRELLYTAVTRARRSVTIIATEASVRAAIGQVTVRTSGLAARLSG